MKIALNKISTPNQTEIDLFRNMSSILSTKYHVTFIEETHQQYVAFHSNSVNMTATREISDLWIIAFSPKLKRARMTFLQAKYHRGSVNHQMTTFYGDYFQYELLSRRPNLTKIVGQRFNFPLDILSFSCCGSIGSYGVFFIDSKKQIDLAYCSAEYLATKKTIPTTYRSHTVDLDIPNHNRHRLSLCSICNQCSELISCLDIDTFTNAILKLEIGAELMHYPAILSFARQVIQQFNNSSAATQFIDFANNRIPPVDNTDNNTNVDGLPINLLIINTDEREG